MKVTGPGPFGSVTGTAAPQRPQRASETDRVRPRRTISDIVAVTSIPPSELTPRVQQAFLALMDEVEHLRDELRVANERLAELERLADTDPLAPIANRRAFVRELSKMISFSERYGATSSLVFFDLNDMKKINDSFGHKAGDAALLHVARTLMERLRQSDTIGRLGGDEFAVILAQSNETQAQIKAQELADAIADNPVISGENRFHVKTAFGVYTFKTGENVDRALEAADISMYEKKRTMKDPGDIR